MSADRNLLYGILALQMDFIGRDALVASMHAWVLDKTRPLGEILIDQKALDPETHALLESLVQRHLALHEGQPAKSLASLPLQAEARQQLSMVIDGDVQASLRQVVSEQPADATMSLGPAGVLGTATSSGTRFRILRPHARGGLGQVWVAVDEELHREVALKEIHVEHADNPDSRNRFLVEAEITGGLEHPGVVPVYGLGKDAGGRLFYVMRFIKGDTLQSALERFHQGDAAGRDAGQRALALRKLLARFIDVCNAIDYAHSRGVLHRDIKPSNVMLGRYGETLVVDWGLAKNVQRTAVSDSVQERTLRPSAAVDSSATVMGSAVGTPAFMSPEQAAGQLHRLGPPSDVYSLGATLYAILTGHSPFEDRELHVVLNKVQRGDFPAPRVKKRGVDPALEAICTKAMSLEPGNRYASPRLLADDIEHWLADEPVAAYAEPWPARLSRWSRRHRAWARSAAAALVAVTVVAVAATLLINRQRGIAQQQRVRAERQERRSERNFQHAVAAANALVDEVAEGLKPIAGTKTETVQAVLDSAAKTYEDLLADAGKRPELLAGQARMLNSFSEIYIELGNSRRALDCARQSLALYEALSRTQPDSGRWLAGRAASYERLGVAEGVRGQSTPARRSFEKCLELRRRLLAADRDNQAAAADVATALYRLANVLEVQGDYDQAAAMHGEAFELRRRAADAVADNRRWQRNLARSRQSVAQALLDAGREEQALADFQSAMDTLSELARREPGDDELATDLAETAVWYGGVMKMRGDCTRAKELFEVHQRIARRQVDQDPMNAEARRRLLDSRLQLGDLLCDAAALDEQQVVRTLRERSAVVDELLQMADEQSARDPGNYTWHNARARLPLTSALALASLAGLGVDAEKNFADAAAMCDLASQRARRLVRRDADNAQWALLLAHSYETLGQVQSARGQTLASIHQRLKADELRVKVCARWLDKFPGSTRWRADLAYNRARCATYLHLLAGQGELPKQRLAAAAQHAQQAIDAFAVLLADQPEKAEWLDQLSVAEGALGIVLSEQGDPDAAVVHYSRSRETSAKADKLFESQRGSRAALREKYGCSMSVLAFRVIVVREQAELARGTLSLSEQLVRLAASDENRQGLVHACWNLAETLADAPTRDHVDEARLALRRGRSLLKSLRAADSPDDEALEPLEKRLAALQTRLSAIAPASADQPLQTAVDQSGYLSVARDWISQGRSRQWMEYLSRELQSGDSAVWAVYPMAELADDAQVRQALTDTARAMLADDPALLSGGGQRLIGFLARSAGDHQTAAEFYQRLADARTDDADALQALAEVLMAAWRYDEAEGVLRRLAACKSNPSGPLGVYQALVEVLLGLGKQDASAQILAKALAIDAEDYYNRVLAARQLALERRLEKAHKELDGLVAAGDAAEPALYSARLALALVLDELGRGPEAQSQLEAMLKIENAAVTRAVLAYLHLRHGRPAEEVRLTLEECRAQAPGNPYVDTFYALALSGQEDAAAGLAMLEPLMEHPILSWRPEFLDELGDVYERAGRPGDARRSWQRALENLPATSAADDRRKAGLLRKLAGPDAAN